MDDVDGARTFQVAGAAYDDFMGRYSRELAPVFVDAAGVVRGQSALDVGCGPGALTSDLVGRLGGANVAACDPSDGFVAACRERHPTVRVATGRAEALPFDDGEFDHALAQLVLHFVSEPDRAAAEMRRVVRPGGQIAACVWDFDDGMELLRAFWDAALELDPDAPDEARTLRFGRPGEIVDLFVAAGLESVVESTLAVQSGYASFDELWQTLLHGVGPAGAHCVSLPGPERDRLADVLYRRLGEPAGEFSLAAVARCAVGRVPADG